MADVFLSYAREDAPQVEKLAAALEKAGLSVWWDQQLAGGARYLQKTEAELRAAAAVIVVWTKTSVESHWVCDEAAEGRDNGKLVPISLDGSAPPLGFRQFQVLDFARWKGGDGEPMPRLLSALTHFKPAAATETSAAPKEAAPTAPSALLRIPRRKLLIGGAATALVAVAGATWTFWPKTAAGDRRIAVMPFVVAGGEPADAYLGEGLAREVIESLKRIPKMKVSARTSSFVAQRLDAAPATIAERLRASHLLYGDIRREGDEVHIVVRLVEAGGGEVSSHDFLRKGAEFAGIEDDIAEFAASALRVASARPNSFAGGLPPPDIYNLYLRGRAAHYRRSPPDLKEAIVLLERVVAAAPQFGKAWGALSLAYTFTLYFTPAAECPAMIERAIETAETGLKLDPDFGDAYAAKAQLTPPFGRWAEIEDTIQAGLRIDPENVSLLSVLSAFQLAVGRVENGYETARKLFEVDPLCPKMTSDYVRSLSFSRRPDEAQERISYAQGIWPNHFLFWEERAFLALENDAMRVPKGASAIDPAQTPPEIAAELDPKLYELVGGAIRIPDSRPAAVAAVLASARQGQNQAHRAIRLLGLLGENEDASEIASQLLIDKGFRGPPEAPFYARWPYDMVWPSHLFAPSGAGIRAMPAVTRIAEATGLADYWRTGKWADFCETEPGSACRSLRG